jgi:NAD(P)-dependent dehydrogenase (short-subunit alcohol dehydrogenase family)
MQVEGKVAVVTGAGAGIGRALAVALAGAGARVVVGDIDGEGADRTAGLIASRDQPAAARQADASSVEGIGLLIGAAEANFAPVDIYVANAGIAGPPGLAISEQDWDHIFGVNVRAHIRAAALLVPGWIERGGGYFVGTASAAGLLTQIGAAGYSVTKHAAVGFAEWLAITYGDNGIGVSCLCPMGVNTALLTSLRASPEAAAQLAVGAVTRAGEVLEPEQVAELTVDAIRQDRFLVLPHPQVLSMYRQKGADYDAWIAGMRRYQRALGADG